MGSTNSDLSTILRDHTGNRRFIQFATLKVRARDLKTIDADKIWKSVDEDAPNPLEANEEIISAIEGIQSTQRHLSAPESWVMDNGSQYAAGWYKCAVWWEDFKEYVVDKFPGEKSKWTVRSFGTELERLSKARQPVVDLRIKNNQREFAIVRRPAIAAAGTVRVSSAANLNSEFATNLRPTG